MMTNPSSEPKGYFHLCSDGALTPQFIICDEDFRVAFNLVGVCAANSDVVVLSFSIEDTHLHALMYGARSACVRFKTLYEESWIHHVARVRGSRKGAEIDLDVLPVDTEDYLMSTGTYTIVQPTKDGKQVMPYDYRWGTGSMYFRRPGHRSIWTQDDSGTVYPLVQAGSLSTHELRRLLCSKLPIPEKWYLCNDILLPDNYVSVSSFERIYRTANCYRVFLASSRSRDQAVQERIAAARGVALDDAEARTHCHTIMMELFGFKDVRRLDAHQRIQVAQLLRKRIRLSSRQIAAIVRLPYTEVCKYV